MSDTFAEIERLENEIGKDAVFLVLDILGGPAGQTRYIPSASAWAKRGDRESRNFEVRRRFEYLMREEYGSGPGFTLRAYRGVAAESGVSVRQVQRIIASKD